MQLKRLSVLSLLAFLVFGSMALLVPPSTEQNAPPIVQITKPLIGSNLKWNTMVPFAIDISDEEDGKSAYDEIQNNEVLLHLEYLSDSTQIKAAIKDHSKPMHEALFWISRSNCFNCHRAKTKLIGPSFEAIAERYVQMPNSIEILTEKIIDGSDGVWGEVKMPPNPDLEKSKAEEIVHWILKHGMDEGHTYFVGTEGAFKTKEKEGRTTNGICLLTAMYRDHGINDQATSNQEGVHTLLLEIKD